MIESTHSQVYFKIMSFDYTFNLAPLRCRHKQSRHKIFGRTNTLWHTSRNIKK